MSKMVRNLVRWVTFACVIFGLSESAIIDTVIKCPAKNATCQTELFQDILSKIGENGIPEINIPPIDPIHIENISLSALNLVNITLVDGVVKGIKDCVFEEFTTDFENSIGKQKMVCNLEIAGHYKLSGASPLIESVLGGSEIHGDGNAKVKLEKLRIEFDFPISTIRRDDGEIYVKCEFMKAQKKFDILGKVTFGADKIFLGNEDVSELLVNYLNGNWQFIMKSFGQVFYDKASEIYFDFVQKFFNSVPANIFITDDLTPYVKN